MALDGRGRERDNCNMMRPFDWPAEQGWPYGDDDGEDAVADFEDAAGDASAERARRTVHLGLEHLKADQRWLVSARFGLEGEPERSLRELSIETGRPSDELRFTIDDALDKLRGDLGAA